MQLRHIFSLCVLLAACDGFGNGCSGCDGLDVVPYPTPPAAGGEIQPDVLRARLTQNALDFLTRNIDVLLGTFFELDNDRVVYVIDETLFPQSSPVRLTGAPIYPSSISFSRDTLAQGISLAWLPNDVFDRPGLRFNLHDFELFLDVGLHLNLEEQSLGQATCHIRDDGNLGALQVEQLSFDLRLSLDSSGLTPSIEVVIDGTPIISFSESAGSAIESLSVDPCNGVGTTCVDTHCVNNPGDCAALCEIGESLTQLGGFIVSVLEPLMLQLTPLLAEEISGLLREALQAIPLRLETRFDLAALLGPFFGDISPLHISVTPSESLEIQGTGPGSGLQLGLNGGATTTEAAPCAVNASPPDLAALSGPPPNYTGFIEVIPATGPARIEAYHLAAGVSEGLLAQLSWAAFQTGLVCLDIDAYSVESLAGDSFPFTAGLLTNFDVALANIADPEAPLLVTVRPSAEPAFNLGAGRMIADDVFEPLLEAVVDNLELGIYMLIDESMLRVAAIQADLIVTMGVERDPEQTLELVVENIAFKNAHQVYNEIAPGAEIGQLLELVVDLAVGTLLGDSLRFQVDLADTLSAALGIPVQLRLNALRRDLGPTGAKYLSIYGTLCDESDVNDAANPVCSGAQSGSRNVSLALGQPQHSSMYAAPDAHRADNERWLAVPTGIAHLPVVGGPLANDAYEFQYRVDHGAWSRFAPAVAGQLEVQSPRLKIIGHHQVAVRARLKEDYMSRSQAVSVAFWVDQERPFLDAHWHNDEIRISAFDAGTPTQELLYFARFDEQESWQPVAARFTPHGAQERVQLLARDLAGNVSHPKTLWRAAASLAATPSSHAPANTSIKASAGCQAAPSGLHLLGLLAAALLGRRRRRRRQG